jgi:hypothetical protein
MDFEYLFNLVMCLGVWLVFGLGARALEGRGLWNGAMTMSCILWLLLQRYRHPMAEVLPMLFFAGGLYYALDSTRLNATARMVVAIVVSIAWFGVLLYQLLSLMFYFCAGCFRG